MRLNLAYLLLVGALLVAFHVQGMHAASDPEKSAAVQEKPAWPLDIEADELKPGLVGVYRSLVDDKATLARVEAKPAFYLGHSSPHPRIPPGPFEVTWTGVILLKDAGPISFDAYVAGEL